MNVFLSDFVLKFFKVDYWRLSDPDLLELAEKYNLLSEQDLEETEYYQDIGLVNPNYSRNLLSQSDRDNIIRLMTHRDDFSKSFSSMIASLVSLFISIVALALTVIQIIYRQ